jgi:hypothetical protein
MEKIPRRNESVAEVFCSTCLHKWTRNTCGHDGAIKKIDGDEYVLVRFDNSAVCDRYHPRPRGESVAEVVREMRELPRCVPRDSVSIAPHPEGWLVRAGDLFPLIDRLEATAEPESHDAAAVNWSDVAQSTEWDEWQAWAQQEAARAPAKVWVGIETICGGGHWPEAGFFKESQIDEWIGQDRERDKVRVPVIGAPPDPDCQECEETMEGMRRGIYEALKRAQIAEANYKFMAERAADERLDGYRELGARAADAERERDDARHAEAEIQQQADTYRNERDSAVERAERAEAELTGFKQMMGRLRNVTALAPIGVIVVELLDGDAPE